MSETTIQYGPSLHAFEKWRKSPQTYLNGCSGPDSVTRRQFISEAKLKNYLRDQGRLEAILEEVVDDQHRPDVRATYIQEHYLRTFAILLCIGAGHLIWHFSRFPSLQDEKLPHHVLPAEFPSFPADLFRSFKGAQWQFCPPKFRYEMNNHFSEDEILPIIRREELDRGGTAEVYRIVVDEEYNLLQPASHEGIEPSHPATFVLKTFTTTEAMKDYERECKAYSRLKWGAQPAPHIVTCYGSFTHGNSYNMIFEYADGGTLEDFMQKIDPPTSVEDVLRFWDRLSVIFAGAATLHGHVEGKASASQHFHGLHQDLKPRNILVLSGVTNNPCDVHFKIADLGLATLKPRNESGGEMLEHDRFGTRSYGAPEAFRSDKNSRSMPKKISQAADMWSLGCILSEVAVWIEHDKRRLGEYRRQRREELAIVHHGEEEECFHFEGKILSAVNAAHDDILGRDLASHQITRLMIDGIVKDLLQEGERLNAVFASQKIKRLLTHVSQKFSVRLGENGSDIASVPPTFSPPDTNLGSFAVFPKSPTYITTKNSLLAEEDGHSLMNGAPIADSPGIPNVPTKPKNEIPTKALTEPSNKFSNGAKNATSVMPQQAPPVPTVSVNYILDWKNKKWKMDLPGMFTQSQQRINSSKSTDFVNAINRQNFFGLSDMHAVLSNVFQEHIEKFGTYIQPPRKFLRSRPPAYPQRPLSFYVLTDGKWIEGDIGALIHRMVHQMIEKKYRKEHVAIQFIRFGHDEQGKARLEELDDGLGLKEKEMDIVDHTYWNSNVWKLLLGGQLSRFDDTPSPQEESSSMNLHPLSGQTFLSQEL